MNKGIFTTINNQGSNLNLHYKRLIMGAAYLGIKFDLSFSSFEQNVFSLCSSDIRQGIRVSVNSQGEVTFENHEYKPVKDEYSLKTCEQQPKTGVKLKLDPNNQTFIQLNRAQQFGYDDFLYIVDGCFTETNIANVYFMTGNQIWTPTLNSNILAGTIRTRLLESGYVKERVVAFTNLKFITGVFITNSIKGIQPVTRVDNISFKYSEKDHQLFGQLSKVIKDE